MPVPVQYWHQAICFGLPPSQLALNVVCAGLDEIFDNWWIGCGK